MDEFPLDQRIELAEVLEENLCIAGQRAQ